jgi:Domain of unknown function (DUF1902)
MMSESFKIRAIWDSEAEVFYSESDVPGLVIEAATYEEFVEIAHDLLPEFIDQCASGDATADMEETATARS